MTRGILFIGGLGPARHHVKDLLIVNDVVCAADSGLEVALRHGIRPDAVVGDMDSLTDRTLLNDFPEDVLEIYQKDKDCSDTEIGIAWLRRHDCNPIVIIGGGEGRLDHTLALTRLFDGENSPDYWYTAREVICVVRKSVVFTGIKGRRISIYPLGHGPWKIASKGLHWELGDVSWECGAMSLSNRISCGTVELDVASGKFLLMETLESCLED